MLLLQLLAFLVLKMIMLFRRANSPKTSFQLSCNKLFYDFVLEGFKIEFRSLSAALNVDISIRVGIGTGPISTGIIGAHKWHYEVEFLIPYNLFRFLYRRLASPLMSPLN